MIATIRHGIAKKTDDTESVTHAPIYIIECPMCKRVQMAIDFEDATFLANEHEESTIKGVCVRDTPTVEVMHELLGNIFEPHSRFTHEKYLLYKKKTDEFQPISPTQRCMCDKCGMCFNQVASITIFEDGVFEQVSLTMNCLDCFVICNDRKKGW